MSERPYVLLSVAMSADGYIDDASENRLVLSNPADLDRVDAERARADAILVGANTVRRDDPGLLVRSKERRAERHAVGLPESPLKVTVSGSGDLDPRSRFFTTGQGPKLVYVASPSFAATQLRLAKVATVVDLGAPLDIGRVVTDLASRGVRRLMVEGGGTIHTQFLTADLADEIQLVVAPFFVGDAAAPRFVNPGSFPQNSGNRMDLTEATAVGDVVLMRFHPRRTAAD